MFWKEVMKSRQQCRHCCDDKLLPNLNSTSACVFGSVPSVLVADVVRTCCSFFDEQVEFWARDQLPQCLNRPVPPFFRF